MLLWDRGGAIVPAMGAGNSGSRIGAVALALLAAAALCAAVVVGEASGALIGKDGHVYACYKAKGKRKGAVRLVPKKGKCRKGEKKVSWSAAGPTGETAENGQNGENGVGGEGGVGGEKGTAGTQSLEKQVQSLTSKVTSLESVLKGITNTELLGALGKLQGVSGTGLQEAVAKVPIVNMLCAQSTKLSEQSNAMGQVFEGLSILGGIGLEIAVPQLPAELPKFGC
jgi:hypothetical protein